MQMKLSTSITTGSKAPKIRHYGSSESNDFRVACAVGQENLDHSYFSQVSRYNIMSIFYISQFEGFIETLHIIQCIQCYTISTYCISLVTKKNPKKKNKKKKTLYYNLGNRTFRTKDFSHKSFWTSFGPWSFHIIIISEKHQYKWCTD